MYAFVMHRSIRVELGGSEEKISCKLGSKQAAAAFLSHLPAIDQIRIRTVQRAAVQDSQASFLSIVHDANALALAVFSFIYKSWDF